MDIAINSLFIILVYRVVMDIVFIEKYLVKHGYFGIFRCRNLLLFKVGKSNHLVHISLKSIQHRAGLIKSDGARASTQKKWERKNEQTFFHYFILRQRGNSFSYHV